MPRTHHVVALGSLLLATAAALPAHAAGAAARGDKPAATVAPSAPAGLTGATGTARVMALVAPGGGAVRAKGVKSVGHPGTGFFCVRPTDASIKVDTLIPTVSVDFTATRFVDSIVQFRSTRSICPSGTFEMLALARSSGTQSYVPSDEVQFSFVAP